jgi:hypothetical protein
MRYDHAVLCREVLEVLTGILERKLQAEKATAEKHAPTSDSAQHERMRVANVSASDPLRSRVPAA